MKADRYCMNPMYIYMIKYLMFPKVTLTCFILNIPFWKYSMSPTSIDGFKINRTKAVKHLGLVGDDALTWSHYILTKIACGVGILKRTRLFIPEQCLLTLYQSIIDPYLSYCNTVWGQCNETLLDRLLSLQNKAARSKTNFSSDHNSLLCDYGWLNLHNLTQLDIGVFMYKTQKDLAPDGFYDAHIIRGQLIREIRQI